MALPIRAARSSSVLLLKLSIKVLRVAMGPDEVVTSPLRDANESSKKSEKAALSPLADLACGAIAYVGRSFRRLRPSIVRTPKRCAPDMVLSHTPRSVCRAADVHQHR